MPIASEKRLRPRDEFDVLHRESRTVLIDAGVSVPQNPIGSLREKANPVNRTRGASKSSRSRLLVASLIEAELREVPFTCSAC